MTEDNKQYEISDRKVKGAKYVEPARVDQISAAEFLELVDAVLAVKGVKALRWHQYTPYFNDGEPCEFSVNEAYVKLSKRFGDTDEDGDYGDGYLDDWSLYTYKSDSEAGSPNRQDFADHAAWRVAYDKWDDARKVLALNGEDTSEIYAALRAFNAKTSSFETVAFNNFGDHSEVTATKDGFDVEFYEHD